jgi:hypothetical protein
VDLRAELQRASPSLFARLEKVRGSAYEIWTNQRLTFFTDHTAQRHSERIISLLGEAMDHFQGTTSRLSEHELYVLLSACYLHDIGMQDLKIGNRWVNALTIADYDEIRRRHPAQGRHLIVKGSISRDRDEFNIALDDDQYVPAIALVSQGHGSAFFEESCNLLEELDPAPANTPLRGALLTAMLLMGDELDLHEDRAFGQPKMEFSPTSSLHHHVNHYVTQVRVLPARTVRVRRFQVSFTWPVDGEEYAPLVRTLIVTKLMRQARRTNPIVEAASNGELTWDTRIAVRELTDPIGNRRALPENAKAMLQLEHEREQLVGWDETLRDIAEMLADDAPAPLVVEASEADAGALIRWLRAQAIAEALPALTLWLHISFAPIMVARDPIDVLDRLAAQAREHVRTSSFDETRSGRLGALIGGLAQDLERAAISAPVVVAIEGIDAAGDATLNALLRLVEALESASPRPWFVASATGAPGALRHWRSVSLANVEIDDLQHHLHARLGYPEDDAHAYARRIHAATNGDASSVRDLLAVEREQMLVP